MDNSITVTGVVATTPRHTTTAQGIPITSFRLASSQRRFDRAHQCWIDGDTNWYTVTSFRRLAQNSSMSICKGDRVIITGRIRIRDWETDERSGTSVEINADSIGHDLRWGTSNFVRSVGWSAVSASSDSVDIEESKGVSETNCSVFDPDEFSLPEKDSSLTPTIAEQEEKTPVL